MEDRADVIRRRENGRGDFTSRTMISPPVASEDHLSPSTVVLESGCTLRPPGET